MLRVNTKLFGGLNKTIIKCYFIARIYFIYVVSFIYFAITNKVNLINKLITLLILPSDYETLVN